jgi:S1-C subfamily serine protease
MLILAPSLWATPVASPIPSATPAPSPTGTSRKADRSTEEIAEQVLPAFVFIGGGSGAIISPDGYLLTNVHVAGGSKRWRVVLRGGQRLQAERIAVDPLEDIALLKIDSPTPLPYVPIGDSDRLSPGDSLIAVGNPFALGSDTFEPTVTLGVVSATHIGAQGHRDALQVDVPINPGNSGGPLFNTQGELVGINSSIQPRTMEGQYIKANTGVGFAVSSAVIRRMLPHLMTGGTILHGETKGIEFDPQAPWGRGAQIRSVQPNSPAHERGLQAGDRIVALEGLPIYEARQFQHLVESFPPEEAVFILVEREDREIPMVLPLGRKELPPPRAVLGIDLDPDPHRAVIRSVSEGSGADQAGLRPRDIIKAIDGKPVDTPQALQNHLAQRKPGEAITVRIERNGKEQEVKVTLGSAY